MNYITDYQLDINKGFMCKVNGKTFKCEFLISNSAGKLFYISNILHVADAMGIARHEFIGIFNSDHINHVIYCDSRQQCYDLCQHIVKTYFKPADIKRDIIRFACDNKSYKFELHLLAGKFMWKNMHDDSKPLIDKNQIDIQKIKKELSINIYTCPQSDSFGFDSREDALKFAKWVYETFYNKQEVCEKSRKHLSKYYNPTQNIVMFPNKNFYLDKWNNEGHWYWRNTSIGAQALYEQFNLTKDQILNICNNLNLLAYFWSNILIFNNATDPIKFTDYLIETYIIKKEKTYDTNQLRKERTAISRGAKPAGGIIHGRRSKASVRRGCIKYQTCIGY